MLSYGENISGTKAAEKVDRYCCILYHQHAKSGSISMVSMARNVLPMPFRGLFFLGYRLLIVKLQKLIEAQGLKVFHGSVS